jgi:hypothetical protein
MREANGKERTKETKERTGEFFVAAECKSSSSELQDKDRGKAIISENTKAAKTFRSGGSR